MGQTARTLTIVGENIVNGFKRFHGFELGTECGMGTNKTGAEILA